jgi:hypothetical protein
MLNYQRVCYIPFFHGVFPVPRIDPRRFPTTRATRPPSGSGPGSCYASPAGKTSTITSLFSVTCHFDIFGYVMVCGIFEIPSISKPYIPETVFILGILMFCELGLSKKHAKHEFGR